MRKKLLLLFIAGLVLALGTLAGWYYWTHRYDELIASTARQHGLDPALVKAIIYEESFFRSNAQSSQNAVGLMQVTPIVVKEWIDSTRSRTLGEAVAGISDQYDRNADLTFEEALKDPVVSLHIGCWYLQTLLNRYKDESAPLAVALAAYNAGPTNVERWASEQDRSRLSSEQFIARIQFPATRDYVQKIIERYGYYRRDQDIKD
ncbi:MAG TPA: lytic transglycosylase domain-containing protein [Blastocatellia bacterium]|jgi:soluble lytic murein transglycosylase